MRGKSVPPAGHPGFGALLPSLAVLWLLAGCGVRTSPVSPAVPSSFAKASSAQSYSQTGTAKKFSATLLLADRTAAPPTLTPATLAFGGTPVGSTSPGMTITAVAQDGHPVDAQLTTSGSPFRVTPATGCASSTAACTLVLSFTPSATGTAGDLLRVTDAVNGLSTTATVTGTGIPVPAPALSLPVSDLSFTPTPVGATTAAQPITLTNAGDAPLAFSGFILTGSAAADYTERNTCGADLAAGTTCTLSVFFSPTGNGGRAAMLQIVSNASTTPATLSLTGSGTAVAASTLIPGANADLSFTEAAGTVAHDTSGNGNDCTFAPGGNAPTWANGGLQLNDNTDTNQRFCTFPASASMADNSVMNSRTLSFCAYFNPITAPTGMVYATAFGGSTRNNIGALWLSGAAHPLSAYYMGAYFGNGGEPTYTDQPLVGYHCVTYALGSVTDGTLDHFYIDGAEVTRYGARGTVWDRRAAGDFYALGALPWNPQGLLWATVYAVVAYPSQLTAAGVAHNFGVLQQTAFYNRGLGASAVQNTSHGNILVTGGDSLTNQTPNGVIPYPYLLSLNTSFTVKDTAVLGKLLETEVADSALIDLPLYSPNAPFALISNAAGINDLNVGGSSQAEIVGYRAAIDAAYQQQGFTVLSPSMVSSANRDAEIEAINTALRSAAIASGYFLVDWANEPCLGATGAFANPAGCSFFQADGLHPSQAGENEMARLYSNVVNYLTGATATTPTAVTATSYTLAPADRFLSAQGSTAQTITLPDCYGWSATTPFNLTNANPAYPVMIATTNGFTLDGATAAVPIPPATTLRVYADILSPTTSGCGWHTR